MRPVLLFALLLVALAAGIGWLLLSGDPQESLESVAPPALELEVQDELPPAELSGTQPAGEVRVAAVESPREEAQPPSASPEEELPDPVQVLSGRFSQYPPHERARIAVIYLLDEQTDRRVSRIEARFDGEFELPVHYDGAYTVFAVAQGAPERASGGLRLRVTPGPPPAQLVLPLLPMAGVEGTVMTEEGKPIPGASIQLVGVGYTSSEVVISDEAGRFRVLLNTQGPYDLNIWAEGFVSVLETVEALPGQLVLRDVTLLEPMRLGGIVRWPDGRPAEDVSLFLRSRYAGATGDTNAEGLFAFTGGRPGPFVLYARAGGESGQEFSNVWELTPELDLGALDLTLQLSHTVRGVLQDDTGLVVGEATITLTASDNTRVTRSATTRPDGSFTVTGLYTGEYKVTASGGEDPLTSVAVGPGLPEPNLELALPSANPDD